MLAFLAILLFGLIGISLPAQNPDLYNDILCVNKASNTTTRVSWQSPESFRNATCELAGHQKEINADTSLILQNLPSSGEFIIAASVLYVVQVTCFTKGSGNGVSSRQLKSQELEFLPGSLSVDKPTCTQDSQLAPEDSNGMFMCAWQSLSSDQLLPSTLLWWWATAPNITKCDLNYKEQLFNDKDSNVDRTITLNNIPVNASYHVTATEAWVMCMDDLHRMHRSQKVKLKPGFSSHECKLNAVWRNTGSPTVLPTNSPPVRFNGINVRSIGKGLVLAFSVIIISIGFAVFIYKRYKWYLHRRAQRLLRVEDDPQEENSMEEFQRMV